MLTGKTNPIRDIYLKAIQEGYSPLHPQLYVFNMKNMVEEDLVRWIEGGQECD